MPDGNMGKHHPGFPRTPKMDNMTSAKRHGKTPMGHGHRDYAKDRSVGSPFSASGETQHAAHENRGGRGPG